MSAQPRRLYMGTITAPPPPSSGTFLSVNLTSLLDKNVRFRFSLLQDLARPIFLAGFFHVSLDGLISERGTTLGLVYVTIYVALFSHSVINKTVETMSGFEIASGYADEVKF